MDLATNLIKDAMAPSTQHYEGVSPEALEENIPGAFPDVGDEEPARKDVHGNAARHEAGTGWTTEVVRPRHLGNEGKPPGAGSWLPAPAPPAPAREEEEQGGDPTAGVDSSRGEDPGRPLGAPGGGIRNGVLGAGSDDPRGAGGGAPHERRSRPPRGDVRCSVPGVRESGLGRGGVHNGVVGHGSREAEEDDRRRRLRAQRGEDGGGGEGAGEGVDDVDDVQ